MDLHTSAMPPGWSCDSDVALGGIYAVWERVDVDISRSLRLSAEGSMFLRSSLESTELLKDVLWEVKCPCASESCKPGQWPVEKKRKRWKCRCRLDETGLNRR